MGLLLAGYCAGLVAVLAIISRTVRALVEALTAFFPAAVALGLAAALPLGVTWLVT